MTTTNNTTWTAPRTWSTGELVTASMMNVHVRDNLNALHTPAGGYSVVNEASDYSTNSSTFGDIDSTDLGMTFTTGGGDVIVFFACSVSYSTGAIAYFDFHESVNGGRIGGDDGLLYTQGSTTVAGAVTMVYRFTNFSAASHTIKVQYKVNTGTLTIPAGAALASKDIHPVMFAFEI